MRALVAEFDGMDTCTVWWSSAVGRDATRTGRVAGGGGRGAEDDGWLATEEDDDATDSMKASIDIPLQSPVDVCTRVSAVAPI